MMRFLVLMMTVVACGCSDPSLEVALSAQRRADEVQQAVMERQHEALCVLLYRDLTARLAAEGPLTEAQHAALNAAWNERDLIEFWRLQHERAAALRVCGVTARLYADQAPVDLLLKSLAARQRKVTAAAAERIGATWAESLATGGETGASE